MANNYDAYRKDGSSPEFDEKGGYDTQQHPVDQTLPGQRVHGIEYEEGTRLHRGLKARQITMIAIGGAIGTGLIIGTGAALARAGPGAIFISYTFIGFIVFLVMAALGEMAAWLPLSSGFTGYATRFCDPALGFALGWTYWFKYIIITPNQLTAAALVIQYWVDRDRINPGVFITVFLVVIVLINWLGIKFFGELEFYLSSIKVVVIVGVIILSLVLALGGGPDHDRKGFRYWKNPGAFAEVCDASYRVAVADILSTLILGRPAGSWRSGLLWSQQLLHVSSGTVPQARRIVALLWVLHTHLTLLQISALSS